MMPTSENYIRLALATSRFFLVSRVALPFFETMDVSKSQIKKQISETTQAVNQHKQDYLEHYKSLLKSKFKADTVVTHVFGLPVQGAARERALYLHAANQSVVGAADAIYEASVQQQHLVDLRQQLVDATSSSLVRGFRSFQLARSQRISNRLDKISTDLQDKRTGTVFADRVADAEAKVQGKSTSAH